MKKEDQEKLVLKNIKLKKKIALGLYAKVRYLGFTLDELESFALEGLWEAAKRFDSSKASFPTYAYYRAKGHTIDCIRKEYPLTRKAVEDGYRMYMFCDSPGGEIFNLDLLKEEHNAELLFMGHEPDEDDIEYIELMVHAFSGLKPADQELARLVFIERYTATEIAADQNVSISNVCQKVKRIRNSIKEKLIDELPPNSIVRTALLDETPRNEHESASL